jgi:hypothetical protein
MVLITKLSVPVVRAYQLVLTDSSVQLFGASKLWFGEPIILAKTEEPSIYV